MTYHHSPLVSVHRLKIKCYVCGRRDNCAATRDGARVYCRRWREAGRSDGTQGRDGGMLFILYETDTPPPSPVKKPAPAPAFVADRHIRHAVYSALLRPLPLVTPHGQDLERRGLNTSQIEQSEIRSVPAEGLAPALTDSLSLDCSLEGVAGFYRDRGRWRMVKMPAGYFVPVRDRSGLIQALQIRKDSLSHEKDHRYQWLSSKGYPHGTTSGAPCHVQNPERIIETGRIIVTEGALKAFCAAQYLNPSDGGLLALAGVSTFQENFGEQIRLAFPAVNSVAVSFDRDFLTNRDVKRQLHRLLRSLVAARFESVTVKTWEACEKGIDDFLCAESREVAEVA